MATGGSYYQTEESRQSQSVMQQQRAVVTSSGQAALFALRKARELLLKSLARVYDASHKTLNALHCHCS